MFPEILRTKIFCPPTRHGLVLRPRLTNKLTAGLRGKLTVISAPAGFGKTTLLSEGLNNIPQPVAWVSLDKDDNDSGRFWSYFISALQTVNAGIGQNALAALQSLPAPEIVSILTTLINDISDTDEDIAVVLDDYHVIEAGPIHEAMTFLIDHLPSQIHLVITTRADPPLPLSRLRGRGELIELRADDLRFTLDETAAFLNEVMSLGLSDSYIAVLEECTEGWIASLQMAALSMREREDIPDFIRTFSGTHRFVMGYLADEVLQCQQPAIQSFLLETSILDRLSGPLCNAVTERGDSQQILEHLETANLFTQSLDDERKWFRYHHLFSDLLRHQLTKAHPDLPPNLHRRASEWFEGAGLMVEAINHALAAKDFNRAARLIELVVVPMIITGGSVSTVKKWLDQLPEKLLTERPRLCLGLAFFHLGTGQLDKMNEALLAAESRLDDDEAGRSICPITDAAEIRGYVIGLRGALAWLGGDTSQAIQLCREAIEYLPDCPPAVGCLLNFNLGTAYWLIGELTAASHYLGTAIGLSQRASNFYLSLISMAFLADVQVKQGHLREADGTCREALRLGIQWGGGEPLHATSCAYICLAQILYQRNEVNEAMGCMARGMELSNQVMESTIALLGFPSAELLNELQQTGSTVTKALHEIEELAQTSDNVILSGMANAWLARLSLAHDDLTTAARWLESAKDKLASDTAPRGWLEFLKLTLARFRLARGEVDGLPDLLEELCKEAEAGGRTGNVIEVRILQSLSLQSQGEIDQALASLEAALTLAEPEGYIRIFVDEGEPMAKLLRRALSRGIMPQYSTRLLASFPVAKEEGAQRTKLLTARELEVLRLVADGLSNKEIADKLIIGIGTVKKHTNSIYSKLGTYKRTPAVLRAQELGLL